MAYSNTVREARYRLSEGQQGAIITKWYRDVELDGDGQPTGVIVFEAFLQDDTGQPRCDLVWKSEVTADGELRQVYTCDGISCDGPEGCILQYSLNDEVYLDITEDQQPKIDESCYFRCRCSGETPST